jgi:hypothetical protein
MKITFLRTPKPRRFVHKNIYYNPEKEEREEREKRINKDKNAPFEPSLKGGFLGKSRKKQKAGNNFGLIIAGIFLVLLFIYFFS